MDVLPISSCLPSSLELSISMPGYASSSSTGEGGYVDGRKGLDMNQTPTNYGNNFGLGGEEDWTMEEEEDSAGGSNSGGHPRKKLRLSKEQSRLLEESFRQNHTLNPKQKEALALQLKLKPRQVEVWFQNRRARSKLKQTEMECEYLKRWFGSLTEQNRRLQREVEELRAMKVAPPSVISPNGRGPLPASTLTMCPRCERVTTTTATATATAATIASKVSPMAHHRKPSAAC